MIDKRSDENLIFNTFKNDKSWAVREVLVNLISDEQLIFDTFKNDKDVHVRAAVIDKLSDVQLIKTFEKDSVQDIRDMVAEKLSEMATQDHTEFSDALAELSNDC